MQLVFIVRFPLILNIDSHASVKQQQTIVYYMQQVFGNKLYVDAVDMNARYLPSPECLRRKILIKVNRLIKLCRWYAEEICSAAVT